MIPPEELGTIIISNSSNGGMNQMENHRKRYVIQSVSGDYYDCEDSRFVRDIYKATLFFDREEAEAVCKIASKNASPPFEVVEKKCRPTK